MKDVFSQVRYVYPSDNKSSEQCYEDLLHFCSKEHEIGIVYSHNAPELGAAVKKLECI